MTRTVFCILTNNHVVENADEIHIRLSNGKEHKATIVATDPPSDLAVIKVKDKQGNTRRTK